jgi:hypothetical protein
MLELRMNSADAASAASGWDGGLYRAWTDGPHVAVVLSTRWDSSAEADQFAAAVKDWLEPGQQVAVDAPGGSGAPVTLLIGSDAQTLDALKRAIGSTG